MPRSAGGPQDCTQSPGQALSAAEQRRRACRPPAHLRAVSATEARESPAHEVFNLCALPVLVGLAGAGLLRLTNPMYATVAFLM